VLVPVPELLVVRVLETVVPKLDVVVGEGVLNCNNIAMLLLVREVTLCDGKNVRYWRCRCCASASGGGGSRGSPNAESTSGGVDISNVPDINCFQCVSGAADGVSIPLHETRLS
jgi:hypothetical protein